MDSLDYIRRPISTGYSDATANNSNAQSAVINVRLERTPDHEQSNSKEDSGEDVSAKRLALAPPSTVFLKTKPEFIKPKKFNSRCRLFVGNVSKSIEEFKQMFEPFGEVSEIYINAQGEYGLLKLDTKANACLAKATLDCSVINGKHIIVRFASQQGTSLRVSNLHPLVSNELLRYSFGFFGEVERAVVIMDDQGKSMGQGIVTYTNKTAARRALVKCTEGCFVITGSPQAIIVEPYHENDEEVGLMEKTIPKRNNPNYFKERNAKPRFTEPGTWEHDIAMEWKKLYGYAKKRRDELEMDIQNKKRLLEEKMSMAKVEERTLKDRLKHLDEEREMLRRQLELREKEKDHSETVSQDSFESESQQFSDYGAGSSSYEEPYDEHLPSTSNYGSSLDQQGYGNYTEEYKNTNRGRGIPSKRSPMEWRRGATTSIKRGRYQN